MKKESSKKHNITKELLEDLYINKRLSVKECAKVLGLPTHGGISWRLKKYRIKARPSKFQRGNKLGVSRFKPGKENPAWKGGKTHKLICIDCKQEFYVFPSEKDNFIRCEKCRNKIRKANDLTGKKFGLLTVIKVSGRVKWEGGSRRLWLCKCECGKEHVVRANDLKGGKIRSCGCEQGLKGEKNPKWLGGGLCGFDTYADKLSFAEEIRRSPNDERVLEVKCAYCGRWFSPSVLQVSQRIRVLFGQKGHTGEGRFYCSNNCKAACPTFRKIKYPRGHQMATSREVQPELRQMRLACDEYSCQRCGKTIDEAQLHCHHIEGTVQNPIESADLDNTITLCKKCHKWAHTEEGCRYFELRCE